MAVTQYTAACKHCGAVFTHLEPPHKNRRFCSIKCGVDGRLGSSIARFWSKVDKNGPNGCWLWMGYTDPKMGYGVFCVDHKHVKAHRFSWALVNGAIPEDKRALHNCDNPPCLSPDHLWLGTNADNNLDRDSKGRHVRLVGEKNGWSRLTTEQALEIKTSNASITDMMRKFGISRCHAHNVRKGKVWAHLNV